MVTFTFCILRWESRAPTRSAYEAPTRPQISIHRILPACSPIPHAATKVAGPCRQRGTGRATGWMEFLACVLCREQSFRSYRHPTGRPRRDVVRACREGDIEADVVRCSMDSESRAPCEAHRHSRRARAGGSSRSVCVRVPAPAQAKAAVARRLLRGRPYPRREPRGLTDTSPQPKAESEVRKTEVFQDLLDGLRNVRARGRRPCESND